MIEKKNLNFFLSNPLDENVMKKLENQQRDWHSDVLKRRFPVFHLMFLHAETLKKGNVNYF